MPKYFNLRFLGVIAVKANKIWSNIDVLTIKKQVSIIFYKSDGL